MTLQSRVTDEIENIRRSGATNQEITDMLHFAFTQADMQDSDERLGDNLLHKITKKGYKELVEIIFSHPEVIAANSFLTQANNNKETILHTSVNSGNLELVRFITEHPITNGLGLEYRYTSNLPVTIGGMGKAIPLVYAVENGHLDIVRYFVTEREIKDPFLLQACLRIAENLHFSERSTNYEGVILFLISEGAFPSDYYINAVIENEMNTSSEYRDYFIGTKSCWEENRVDLLAPLWNSSPNRITYQSSEYNEDFESHLSVNNQDVTIEEVQRAVQLGDGPEALSEGIEDDDSISDEESFYSDTDEDIDMVVYESDLEENSNAIPFVLGGGPEGLDF